MERSLESVPSGFKSCLTLRLLTENVFSNLLTDFHLEIKADGKAGCYWGTEINFTENSS